MITLPSSRIPASQSTANQQAPLAIQPSKQTRLTQDTFFSGAQGTPSSSPSLAQDTFSFASKANSPLFGAGKNEKGKGKEQAAQRPEEAEPLIGHDDSAHDSSSSFSSYSEWEDDDDTFSEYAKIPEDWERADLPGRGISENAKGKARELTPELLFQREQVPNSSPGLPYYGQQEEDPILDMQIATAFERFASPPGAGPSNRPADVRCHIARELEVDESVVADHLAQQAAILERQAQDIEQRAQALRLVSGTAGKPDRRGSNSTSTVSAGMLRKFADTDLQDSNPPDAPKRRRKQLPSSGHQPPDWDPYINTFNPSDSSANRKEGLASANREEDLASAIAKALDEEAGKKNKAVYNLRRTARTKITFFDPRTKKERTLSASRAGAILYGKPNILPLKEINKLEKVLLDALKEEPKRTGHKSATALQQEEQKRITYIDPITGKRRNAAVKTITNRLFELNRQRKLHAELEQASNNPPAAVEPTGSQQAHIPAGRAPVVKSGKPKLQTLKEINKLEKVLSDALEEEVEKTGKSATALKKEQARITYIDPWTGESHTIAANTLKNKLSLYRKQIRQAELVQASNNPSAAVESTTGSQQAHIPAGGQAYTTHHTEQELVDNALQHFESTGMLPEGTSEVTARSVLSALIKKKIEQMANLSSARRVEAHYDAAGIYHVAKYIDSEGKTSDDPMEQVHRLNQLINARWPGHS
jgi:hypothetical protein